MLTLTWRVILLSHVKWRVCNMLICKCLWCQDNCWCVIALCVLLQLQSSAAIPPYQQVSTSVRVKGMFTFELGWNKNWPSVELWEIIDCRSIYFIHRWVDLNQITQVIAACFTYSFTILITMQVSSIRNDMYLGKREKGFSGFLPTVLR